MKTRTEDIGRRVNVMNSFSVQAQVKQQDPVCKLITSYGTTEHNSAFLKGRTHSTVSQ